ncbi:MAG TPA: hypothetical protein VHA56_00585 [Mucilaginibacter sp.]|nr:hypothetical protein [Mucilaginibacter sp.]
MATISRTFFITRSILAKGGIATSSSGITPLAERGCSVTLLIWQRGSRNSSPVLGKRTMENQL